MSFNRSHTIAAISTPLATGAISIVRISGEQTIEVFKEHFRCSLKDSGIHRKMYYGKWVDSDETTIDEVQCCFYRSPHSFTGEDMLEIFCHGGIIVTEMVLKSTMNICKIALPGEFSYRAFLNSKIDLIQAQAINDLINVKTQAGVKLLIRGLEGNLSHFIQKLQKEYTKIAAMIEVQLDYPDEIFEHVETEKIISLLHTISEEIEGILKDAENSIRVKNGIDTVILGPPNVGKSTVMNLLLNEDRAIVTDLPGTTRDYIKAELNIKGILINLIDTAGIRQTQDVVETLGVEKTLHLFKTAPFAIFIFEHGSMLDEVSIKLLEESYRESKEVLILLNKTDLKKDNCECSKQLKEKLIKYGAIHEISAKDIIGINELEEYIYRYAKKLVTTNNETQVFNKLQKSILESSYQDTIKAISDLRNGYTIDTVSITIRDIINTLNDLTGRDYNEDIINTIFSDFCLGK
ncbi:MAG TPA: tRNA uridine-5-carboxymethylaminomethyl(34) synthesis GTPase MnmE [Bacteroidales bacterium]|nr:tRNA uridine-5-carboxymethylaminomethyl(34) synthesis GTPase MnmE [Bacteroidales bacterium]HRW33722.1 tRNA uridine-5-carboxymethylaminomethyl(34) synthesis GTPase MnmE [Thermotogota bacterium]